MFIRISSEPEQPAKHAAFQSKLALQAYFVLCWRHQGVTRKLTGTSETKGCGSTIWVGLFFSGPVGVLDSVFPDNEDH